MSILKRQSPHLLSQRDFEEQKVYLVAQGYDYYTSVWIDSVPFDLEGGDDGGDGESETGITPIGSGAVIVAFIGLAGIILRRRRR